VSSMQLQAIFEKPFVPAQRRLADMKLYLFCAAFAAGNLLLPMAVHTVPNGGLIFLPLFFFTLVAAYSEGLLAGILVALASPLINHALTGMPAVTMLPTVLFKSLLLAALAATISSRMKKISLWAIGLCVAVMQLAGALFDYLLSGSAQRALGALRLGVPGMLLMVAGAYLALRLIAKLREGVNQR